MRKAERTRERLAEHALDLFETQGYEATTVAQIAAAAGVTEMTFFRHFRTKEAVVLTDPYDPVIAAGIRRRPLDEPPLHRAVRGLRETFAQLPEPDVDMVRRRVRLIARTPVLRAAVTRHNDVTESAIADALAGPEEDALAARVSAAVVLAALTVGLYAWAEHAEGSLGEFIERALAVLEPDHA
ncbi:TetR family transcriptional regulator [Aeromicrobium phragmitis]|uniref:TetR family transcriptional regulator n=1 Tax=Aeromicrobium phragmitis TaxID=2478914 RepID=A0A3L8PLZ4_9ACTN|nr:TetR family transcriptional regulator [Aeromicrobium phragmitis]